MTARVAHPGKLKWSGYLLGFALGGFFDGILLHQILQWHHLLSLVPGAGDISRQVLFDGLFHAAMYVIAALGLAFLWSARREVGAAASGRLLCANALIGFGTWHIIDSVASHWILGIHRIRVDSDNPLFWDLLWFFAFGVVPVLIGWFIHRGGGPRFETGGGRVAGVALLLMISAAAPWAARPPDDAESAIAVFRPGMTQGQVYTAVTASGGAVLWQSRGVWAVRWPEESRRDRLYASGALIVSNSLLGAGCLAWAKT